MHTLTTILAWLAIMLPVVGVVLFMCLWVMQDEKLRRMNEMQRRHNFKRVI